MLKEIEKIVEKLRSNPSRFDFFDKANLNEIIDSQENEKIYDNITRAKRRSDRLYGNMNRYSLLDLLFTKQYHFIVPFYQRSYVWDEKIYKAFLTLLDENKEKDKTKTALFFGFLILKDDSNDANIGDFKIVDGQQRITSCYLLLAALRDYFWYLGMKDPEFDKLSKYINDNFLVIGPDSRLKLRHPVEDFAGKIFDSIITREHTFVDGYHEPNSDTKLYSHPRNFENDATIERRVTDKAWLNYPVFKRYKQAFKWIVDKGRNWIYNKKEPIEFMEQFLNALDNVTPYVKFMGSVDNEQSMFESLNSMSATLKQSDLIKNYIFSQFDISEHSKIFIDYWVKFEKILEFDYDAIEEFFYLYVQDLTHKFESKKDDGGFWAYKNHCETHSMKEPEFRNKFFMKQLQSIIDYAIVYQYAYLRTPHLRKELSNYNSSETIDICYALSTFNVLDISKGSGSTNLKFFGNLTIAPVVLRCILYWYKGEISHKTLLSSLKIVESYFIRRKIAGLQVNTISRMASWLFSKFGEILEKSKNLDEEICGVLYEELFVNSVGRAGQLAALKNAPANPSSKSMITLFAFTQQKNFVKKTIDRDLVRLIVYAPYKETMPLADYVSIFNVTNVVDKEGNLVSKDPTEVGHLLSTKFDKPETSFDSIERYNVALEHHENVTNRIGNLYVASKLNHDIVDKTSYFNRVRLLQNHESTRLLEDSRYMNGVNLYSSLPSAEDEWTETKIDARSKKILDKLFDEYIPDSLEDLETAASR